MIKHKMKIVTTLIVAMIIVYIFTPGVLQTSYIAQEENSSLSATEKNTNTLSQDLTTPSVNVMPTPMVTPTPMATPSEVPSLEPSVEPSLSQKPLQSENKQTSTKAPTKVSTKVQTKIQAKATKAPSAPAPTQKRASGKNILGFTTYYYNGDKSSYNSMLNHKSIYDEIAAHSPLVDGQGNITYDYISTDQVRLANENKITPYVLIGNNFSGATAKTLLESPKNRANFIENLLSLMKKFNYKGVNIDLEGVYSSNRNDYTKLIKEVYLALSPLGYTVSASVPAKTVDNPKNSWNGAFDYAAISKYLDKLILMAYDEHWSGGAAGPVASIGWVEDVLSYTVSVVPKDKIYLGLAAYGYDWSESGSKSYGINGCYNTAEKYNANVVFDSKSKTPFFKYKDDKGVSHTVWFENAQSISYKLNLVNKFDISGVAIWRVGLENRAYMDMLESKLK